MSSSIEQLKLNVLYKISEIVGQALRLNNALEAILGVLSGSLAMEKGTITLLDRDLGRLVIFASHGLTEEEKLKGVYRVSEGVTGQVFSKCQPFIIPDISHEPMFLNRTGARKFAKNKTSSFIGVPVTLDGRSVGVLSVDRIFGSNISLTEDAQFLTILATLIAQMVRLNDEVKHRESSLREEVSDKYQKFMMVGKSRAMKEVWRLVRKVAPTRATVLLLGESGTGKTLISRIVHELSSRSKSPFVKINCASLPENLLESELFGYERGAFTGATNSKPGRLEQADGGTVFLDEIGELPLGLQAKLLQFLQDREFERLGGSRTLKVDTRLVAATNRDLASEVRAGKFREDLYYRLNVFPIYVPPLRERQEDILPLIHHFLSKVCRDYGRRFVFSVRASAAFTAYSWPGNVREMENLVERLAILEEKELLESDDIEPYLSYKEHKGNRDHHEAEESLDTSGVGLKEMERQAIIASLRRNGWIMARAARELGLTKRQIGYRVRVLGIQRIT